ncbi:cytochrome c3 family protein [Hippea jasoniae]|uniref:cytochrome c3 family protein n=1 Tax=Hippea jasoniae TaxID=944479 RepID=UPI0005587848|nr:cytochrome c3 family protein [Hippea jasoniae]
MLKIVKTVLILFTLLFIYPTTNLNAKDISSCNKCHTVEKIDNIHKLTCIECHVLEENRNNIYSHKQIIKNPSELKYAKKLCIKCHKKDIERLTNSMHYTLSSVINITRFAWDKQKNLLPTFAAIETSSLKQIPDPATIKQPSDLVDILLRRKCARCHINSSEFQTTGTYRLSGCAACHAEYSKNGHYLGSDRVLYGKKVYSKTHRLFKHPKMSSCLSCHNNEFVGTDYIGLFPQDYHKDFRSPIMPNGYFKPRIYGIGQHALQSDIHFRSGMTCVDCHKKEGVMGDFKQHTFENEAVKVSCESCHGGYKSNPKLLTKEGLFITTKGKKLKPKLFDKNLYAHKYHQRVKCSACHSLWQSEHFGMNLYFDKSKLHYDMFKKLITQEDPYVEMFLKRALKNPSTPPKSYDYLDKTLKKGIWYQGWIARRWMPFILIVDNNGKYSVAREIFNYKLTYVNENGTVVFDNKSTASIVMGYSPHTIGIYGKSCEACHNNKLQLNPDFYKGTVVEEFFKGMVINGRKLTKKELEKLTSPLYKKERSKILIKNLFQ